MTPTQVRELIGGVERFGGDFWEWMQQWNDDDMFNVGRDVYHMCLHRIIHLLADVVADDVDAYPLRRLAESHLTKYGEARDDYWPGEAFLRMELASMTPEETSASAP